MKLVRTVLAATATLGLGLAMAVPAQADHTTEATVQIKGATCQSGELASGTYQALFDPKAKVKINKDGTESWSCTFRNVGASSYEENGYGDYEVPTRTVRYTAYDTCIRGGSNGEVLAAGNAEIVSKPNGTITIGCVVTPVDHSDHEH